MSGAAARLSAIAMLCAVAGCGWIWNYGDREMLVEDVRARLEAQGIATPLDCHLIGTTHNGVCRLDLTAAQARRLIEGLGLQPAERRALRGGFDAWASPIGCRQESRFGPRGSPRVFTSGRGDAAVEGFAFWILFLDPGSDAACLEVGYAGG